MTKQIGNSELIETWASEGDTSEPFLSKRQHGWLYQEQPASSLANFLINEQQQKINHLLKNGLSEWSENTPYVRGACVKHAGTAWRALAENEASEPAPENTDWKELDSLPVIRAPDLISPVDGVSDVSTAAPLVASEYAPVYSVDDRDFRLFEVDVAGGDFSAPVRSNEVDADAWNVDPVLDTSGGYIWRCRDVSTRGDVSPWSDVGSFTTGDVFVTQPAIASPANNATGIGETPTLTSGSFAVTGGSDAHAASYWRVFRAGVQVWASGRKTDAKTSISVPAGILVDGETTYTAQVRHEGAALGLSSWSTASTFTTLDTFSRVATPSIVSPLDNETGVLETPGIASSAFSVINGSDTHRASFWEVYAADDSLVWSSGRSFTNRTSVTLPQGILQDSETGYKVRVRHEGASLGVSDWSDLIDFTTALNFGRLFIGSEDNLIRSLNRSDLSQRAAFSAHIGKINGLAFGTGGFLYSASQDGTVRKLSGTTLTQDAVNTAAGGPVLTVCFGTDGAVYTASGSVVRKHAASNLIQTASLTADGPVRALAFGGDGNLYVGSGQVVEQVDQSNMTLNDDYTTTDNTTVLSLAFGADGFVYAGYENSKIRRIDPSDMTQSQVFDGQSTTVTWQPYSLNVASVLEGTAVSTSLSAMNSHAESQFALFEDVSAGNRDGVTINYLDRTIGPFGASPNTVRMVNRSILFRKSLTDTLTKEHRGSSYEDSWGASGTWLPGDGRRIWRIRGFEAGSAVVNTLGPVNALAFGSDGFLYAGFGGNSVRKFTASTLAQSGVAFTGHTQSVRALAFGADGFLYSGGDDRNVRKINPLNMTQSGLFQGGASSVTALAFNVAVPDLLEFPL